MAYYSTRGPNNYCCYREHEVEKKRAVEIAAPIDYVWAILTNVHDYNTWSDFALSGSIDEGAVITLKDNATVVQSDDGRLHKVKSVNGRVSTLINNKAIELSFDRGELGWSVSFAFYLEELSQSVTKVKNLVRFFGPYSDIVDQLLNERMGHLKLFCEHSHSVHASFDVKDSSFPVAVGVTPVVSTAEAVGDSPTEDIGKDPSISHADEASNGNQGYKPGSITDEIVRLADLHTKGLLSEDEFAAAKRRLLFDSNGYTRLYG